MILIIIRIYMQSASKSLSSQTQVLICLKTLARGLFWLKGSKKFYWWYKVRERVEMDGWSLIEVEGVFCEFLVGDGTHPQSKEIF